MASWQNFTAAPSSQRCWGYRPLRLCQCPAPPGCLMSPRLLSQISAITIKWSECFPVKWNQGAALDPGLSLVRVPGAVISLVRASIGRWRTQARHSGSNTGPVIWETESLRPGDYWGVFRSLLILTASTCSELRLHRHLFSSSKLVNF